MKRALAFGITVATASLLAACGSAGVDTSPTPASSSSSASTPTATPVPTPPPTAVPTPSQSAAPTSYDPCQLVTASEASSLAGVSYGAGKEETNAGGGRDCVYGADTLNVFTVIVGVASSAAAAQAEWATEEAQVKSALDTNAKGVNVDISIGDTSLSGADMAAVGTGTASIEGVKLAATVVYFLKGAVFVSFSDLVLGKAAPSESDMETEANTVLGRI
jgi:Protein of unknown function (DUF3558)